MEKIIRKENIQVLCEQVFDFPLGIKEVFDSLMGRFGTDGREYYGISYMDEQGRIVYKAAVSGTSHESVASGYEAFTIVSGEYMAETIQDWMSKTNSIKDIFGRLMTDPGFDHGYPCIEWYKSDDEMVCMVKLK